MQEKNDDRTLTVTTSTLKKYESAVSARYSARTKKERLGDALDQAKIAYENAVLEESNAVDALLAALKTLTQNSDEVKAR